jgi:hypothetical protein
MKEPNMKRRALFAPAALLAGALAAGTPTPAAAQVPDALVPVAGIVTGQPESVSFSGQARISSKLVPDPDFGNPSLLLTVDLTSVSGVGQSTKAKYVVSTRELVQRRLAGSQLIVITFPFTRSGSTTVAPRSGVVSLDFNVDLDTGAIRQADAEVSSPPL